MIVMFRKRMVGRFLKIILGMKVNYLLTNLDFNMKKMHYKCLNEDSNRISHVIHAL